MPLNVSMFVYVLFARVYIYIYIYIYICMIVYVVECIFTYIHTYFCCLLTGRGKTKEESMRREKLKNDENVLLQSDFLFLFNFILVKGSF